MIPSCHKKPTTALTMGDVGDDPAAFKRQVQRYMRTASTRSRYLIRFSEGTVQSLVLTHGGHPIHDDRRSVYVDAREWLAGRGANDQG